MQFLPLVSLSPKVFHLGRREFYIRGRPDVDRRSTATVFGGSKELEESHLEESILRSLRRISRAIGMHSRQLKRNFHLTAPQLVCLRHLLHGPCSPSALAQAVSLSPGTVTGILDRLERRNLIIRTRLQSDKRRILVLLTDEAKELLSKAPPPLHNKFAERLGHLMETEQQQIDRMLKKIVSMMEADEIDAAPMLMTELVLAEADDGVGLVSRT